MANFYSDVATTYNSSKGLHERVSDSRITSGDLKMLYVTYTSAGTELAADTIYLARVKEGMLFLPMAGGFVYQTGIAGTTAGTIGIDYDTSDDGTDDADAFFASATITASTRTTLTGALATTPAEITGNGWIYFDPATLTTPAADKVFVLAMPYVQTL